jgi:hypothetical protein
MILLSKRAIVYGIIAIKALARYNRKSIDVILLLLNTFLTKFVETLFAILPEYGKD